MTKSKKMKKSTFAIVIMAILMVAMLAFGGTYAYFTANANVLDSKTATVGQVRLTASGTLTVETTEKLLPGDKIFSGSASFVNDSTVDTIVVANFTYTYTGLIWDADSTTSEGEAYKAYVTPEQPTGIPEAKTGKLFHVTNMPLAGLAGVEGLNVDAKWTKVSDTAYLYTAAEGNYALAAGTDTVAFISDSEVKLDAELARHFENGAYVGTTDGELAWEAASITVSLSFQQVQYEGVAPEAAESAAAFYADIKADLK